MALIVVIGALVVVGTLIHLVFQILAPVVVLLARGVVAWFRQIFRG
ncbi:MAG TPA: hypothetical protein VMP11_10695 [Verrucomicrobiae bacterium]|nr:hypothetical protein [Verrucomicrobiae bacterium]